MPVEIKLKKSEFSVPWGFRLNGGKDFGAPLTAQRIKPDSIASRCGLREGDNISMINSESTQGLKHFDAQELIKKAGCQLDLVICRGDEIIVKHNKDNVDSHELTITESKTPQVCLTPEPVSHYKASHTATPYKVPSNITSNNAALYKPSMQTITSGLTKTHISNDSFPPPPPPPPPAVPTSFTPHKLTPMQLPDVSVTDANGDQEATKLPASETLRLVKEIDAGGEIPFSPKTGAGVKSSPIQSRLMGILEKKHGQVQYEMNQEVVASKGGYVPYPKSPMGRNSPSDFKGPSSVTIDNQSTVFPFNKPSSQLQPASLPHQRASSPHQRSTSPHPPSSNLPSPHPPSNTTRKLLESIDKGALPICNVCNTHVRGAYVLAINKIWCPEHFVCSKAACRKPLSNTGFVEEGGELYCKEDYEKYFAPKCAKCSKPIVGNTVKALNQAYHPECFRCQKCQQPIAGGVFHLHEGQVYCDKDFSEFFSTKCQGCKFAIEAGDNWIEAAGTNWHGECFNCSVCHTNLQSVGFVNRNGRFLCKDHARMA